MRAPRHVRTLAKDLRRNQTPAEAILWDALRRNQSGRKFHRQRPVGRYIADFYCPQARLVIELDGPIHDTPDRREYDAIRDQTLSARGLRVLRLTNAQIESDLDGCLAHIDEVLSARDRG